MNKQYTSNEFASSKLPTSITIETDVDLIINDKRLDYRSLLE